MPPFFLFLCSAFSLCFFSAHAAPHQKGMRIPTIAFSAPYAFLMDLQTGTILLDRNGDKRMYPSSMTKIMTVYLAFKALSEGTLSLESPFLVSRDAAKKEGTRMMLIPNQKVTLDDLLKGIIVASGNDASTVFAEGFAGSEQELAIMMTEEAKRLGARNSHFMNASGLPDPNHWTTCKDLALIAQKTIENFPEFYKNYYSMSKITFNKVTQYTKNKLLLKKMADGLKTGRTEAAGFGMVISDQRDGRRLLLVINGLKDENQRTQEALSLLNWGFNAFKPVLICPAQTPFCVLPVQGSSQKVSLICKKNIGISLPQRLISKCTVTTRRYNMVNAPIQKGALLGKVDIIVPEQPVVSFDLVAQESIATVSVWDRCVNFFRNLFQ